eukprot:SRR837773.8766.p3 GENE.SRR837773.8766~~SRR837773.8766.p3  ORF type:complete len:152 (-),score=21.49 SRR837773.8766:90-545(-)
MVVGRCTEAEDVSIEPLMTGLLLYKKPEKRLWLARALARTPARRACWRRLYFEVGPGPRMQFWQSLEARRSGGEPEGRIELASADISSSGKELVIGTGAEGCILRASSPKEAKYWLEACMSLHDSGPVQEAPPTCSMEDLVNAALNGGTHI